MALNSGVTFIAWIIRISTKTVFIGRLSSICGGNIITDKPRLAVYEADGLTAKKQLPWVVVLPLNH